MVKDKKGIVVYNERIISDPGMCGGDPVVKGTRIPVWIVLEALEVTPDRTELFADYPELTEEDIQAALSYAQDVVKRQGSSGSQKPDSDKQLAPI